jgi:hypothetical protein
LGSGILVLTLLLEAALLRFGHLPLELLGLPQFRLFL